jgi:hypothetical protein
MATAISEVPADSIAVYISLDTQQLIVWFLKPTMSCFYVRQEKAYEKTNFLHDSCFFQIFFVSLPPISRRTVLRGSEGVGVKNLRISVLQRFVFGLLNLRTSSFSDKNIAE